MEIIESVLNPRPVDLGHAIDPLVVVIGFVQRIVLLMVWILELLPNVQ